MLQFDTFIILFAAIIQVFKGGKLFKCGNYSGEETINNQEVLTAETIQRRKLYEEIGYVCTMHTKSKAILDLIKDLIFYEKTGKEQKSNQFLGRSRDQYNVYKLL